MTRTRLRLVAIAVTTAVVLSGCGSVLDLPLPGGAKVGKNPITVHVMFRDVLDLVPQSTVKVDDVTVGKVKAVKLKGYVADVTLSLPHDVDLPDNAVAEIRQTSLLGEKFVSLSPPPAAPSSGKLGNGDVIPLTRTGRNPEVEEVLGALSLLLNGGGVGQLKTIAAELNNAFGGRESDVRSVLDQLEVFTGQLNANKTQIIASIDSLNRLAVQLRKQDGTIKAALDDLPAAIASINTQRADLVKTLQALQKLSGIGTQVIQASKVSTINSLTDLAPTLDKLAEAGSALPKSLQVSLTYPFVDEAVGRDPQVARNLHMGDFVNLDARLDINLTQLPTLPSVSLPTQITQTCQQIKDAAAAQITTTVDTYVDDNFPLLTKAQKDALKNGVIKNLVASIDCKDPLNGLKNLPNVVLAVLGVLNIPLPTGLPTLISIPPLGLPSLPIVGGLRGGNNRPATNVDPAKADVLNGTPGTVDTIGYNSTLAALLLQGVKR
ncbi:MAG: virulence factor Mce family protein [Nocardioidaceae bacterium]|nr:virulence factor Mce family protein [Nocardioidaceae bacterium]